MDVALGSVFNVKLHFAEGGQDGVLNDRAQGHRYRKMDDQAGSHLIALGCTPTSEGHDHWMLRALADKAVELGLVESQSHEAVRLNLKETSSNRGRRGRDGFPG